MQQLWIITPIRADERTWLIEGISGSLPHSILPAPYSRSISQEQCVLSVADPAGQLVLKWVESKKIKQNASAQTCLFHQRRTNSSITWNYNYAFASVLTLVQLDCRRSQMLQVAKGAKVRLAIANEVSMDAMLAFTHICFWHCMIPSEKQG